jgi:hypothetical protein
MHAPHILTTWHDPRHDVKYHVLAYRALSRPEAFQAVQGWLKARQGRSPRRGQEVTIYTLIGVPSQILRPA